MLLAMVALVAVTACADKRGGAISYNQTNFGAPDVVLATADDTYHIGSGDTLTVTVFRVPDLSGDHEVDASGRIEMPLVGLVAAVGKTTDQLAAELKTKLSATYLQSPQVIVAVKDAVGQRVTIDGSVTQPGVYAIASNTTLIQAIAMAKGTTAEANSRRVAIFRTINGQRQAAAFDLTDIRRGLNPDPRVFPNDIVVVDGSGARSKFRDVISTIPVLNVFNALRAF